MLSTGLSSLTRLGHVGVDGAPVRLTGRVWKTGGNGNPDSMLDTVRGYLGTQDSTLFIIERDVNRNVCHYQVNLTASGGVDPVTPVAVEWFMVAEDTDTDNLDPFEYDMGGESPVHTEQLNMIERTVYGVGAPSPTQFTVNALRGEMFNLRRRGDGWCACVTIDGVEWVLHRVMLHTSIGFTGPRVDEVHLDVESPSGGMAQFFYAT